MGNGTQRLNRHWGIESWYGRENNLSYTYKNDRVQGSGWLYDADGRTLQTSYPDDYANSIYNAAGQMVRSTSSYTDAVRWYNADGREAKRMTANLTETQTLSSWSVQPTKYYVRSTVLGGEVVSEVWASGRKAKSFVFAAGSRIAYQSATDMATPNETVFFEHSDPPGTTQRTADQNASVIYAERGEGSPVEADPFGGNMGTATPYIEEPVIYEPPPEFPDLMPIFDDSPMYVNGQRLSCYLDGMSVGCSFLFSMSADAVAQCPNNDCSPRRVTYQGQEQWAFFYAYADGYSGFIPMHARYVGNGGIAPTTLLPPVLLGRGESRFPNDTNLVALNGASGRLVGEVVQVLNNIGVDAFWKLNINVKGGWWNVQINNASRERIQDEDLDKYRYLMERTLATSRCSDFLKKVGVDPENVLRAFDLTRVQGGFSWGGTGGWGGLAGGNVDSWGGATANINRNPVERFVVLTFVHEDIHNTGPNDHVMAKRFDDLGLFPKPNYPGEKVPRYVPGNTTANSLAWDGVLGNYCQPTEAEYNRWMRERRR